METEDIQVEVKNRVCWITLNRPKKLNSLTIAMHDSIRSTLDDLDESVKCVVITGSGSRAFSAGADISEIDKLTPEEAENYSQEGHKTIMKILNYPKPVIAVIQGYALGGGLELALSCDFRLATENSRFGFPETKLGLIPGWGGAILSSRLIGLSKAKELLMTGEYIRAPQALSLGLINKVIEAEKLLGDVNLFIEPFIDGSSQPMHEIKKLLLDRDMVEGKLLQESKAFGVLMGTFDAKEGIEAFKEKRKPQFK